VGGQEHDTYRVTIRHFKNTQQYQILEVEADSLRSALSEALARFPAELADTADLIEIRLANPAERG